MLSKNDPCLLVVLGPTASGKSDLALALARKFGGEIISADSRQVYKGLDIGSGKVTMRERRTVPHHLLDVSSLKKVYTVHEFQADAARAIRDIQKRGKLPILCGGTGFWIESVLGGYAMPAVKPSPALRKKLQKFSAEQLFALLRKKDPARAKTVDRRNPFRLIRALEIIEATKRPVPPLAEKQRYTSLVLGIELPRKELYRNIHTRLQKRLKQGMFAEVRRLLASGVPAKRLIDLGLEYRYCTLYLQGELSRTVFEQKLEKEIRGYSKRQMTWFRRMEKRFPIHWIRSTEEATDLVKNFTFSMLP